MDELHTEPPRSVPAKRIAHQLIDRLEENDRAAVVSTRPGAPILRDFSSNRAVLHAAVERFVGSKPPMPPFIAYLATWGMPCLS
jgi:hypothetical protein